MVEIRRATGIINKPLWTKLKVLKGGITSGLKHGDVIAINLDLSVNQVKRWDF